MENADDLEILDYTSEVAFPYIKELTIINPPSAIQNGLQNLLKYSFPNNLRIFSINWYPNQT